MRIYLHILILPIQSRESTKLVKVKETFDPLSLYQTHKLGGQNNTQFTRDIRPTFDKERAIRISSISSSKSLPDFSLHLFYTLLEAIKKKLMKSCYLLLCQDLLTDQ
jgi:hypothetical protein